MNFWHKLMFNIIRLFHIRCFYQTNDQSRNDKSSTVNDPNIEQDPLDAYMDSLKQEISDQTPNPEQIESTDDVRQSLYNNERSFI